MIANAGVTGPGGTGLGAYGLVISAYGSTNLLGTVVIGSRTMPARPGRLIFAGNVLGGFGTLLLGAAGLLLPAPWQLPAFCAAAAIGAVAGPMQDIAVSTLRQTELPRTDVAAAMRSFIVMNNVGLLLTLAAAPGVFDAVGVPQAVVLCGVIYAGVGVAGLVRFAREAG
jgi:hypothetical protein